MAKIFLTGAKGQVGSDIEFALLKRGHTVIATTHQSLDISKDEAVMSAILDSGASAVINAAAYTNVEKAEAERPQAFNVNALGARNIAKACAIANIPLIHISSDYVLAKGQAPFVETDTPEPESVYGLSKLEGENYIRNIHRKHLIIRTSWIFGRFKRNFVKVMLSLAQDRNEIAVVNDQFGNPTPSEPLAEAVVNLTERALDPNFYSFGTYHYAGYPDASWNDFAKAIFSKAQQMHVLSHEVKVRAISSEEFKSKVKRPMDSRLDTSKITDTFGLEMPCWVNYLGSVIQSYVRECQGLQPIEGYDNTLSALKGVKNPSPFGQDEDEEEFAGEVDTVADVDEENEESNAGSAGDASDTKSADAQDSTDDKSETKPESKEAE